MIVFPTLGPTYPDRHPMPPPSAAISTSAAAPRPWWAPLAPSYTAPCARATHVIGKQVIGVANQTRCRHVQLPLPEAMKALKQITLPLAKVTMVHPIGRCPSARAWGNHPSAVCRCAPGWGIRPPPCAGMHRDGEDVCPGLVRAGGRRLSLCPVLVCAGVGNTTPCLVLVRTGIGTSRIESGT